MGPAHHSHRRAATAVGSLATAVALVALSLTVGQVEAAWDARTSGAATFASGEFDTAGSYPAHIAASSPAGYWRLDETPGQDVAEDSAPFTESPGNFSTGVYDGTYQGSPLRGQDPARPLQTRRSVELSGTGQHVSVPDGQGVFDFDGWHSFSVELWVRPTPRGDQQQRYERLVAKQVPGGNGMQGWAVILRRWWEGGQERTAVYFERGPNQTGHAVIPLDRWTHVAAVFEGQPESSLPYLNLYVGGSRVSRVQATNDTGSSLPDNRNPLTFGGLAGSDWFRGRLDEVSVYWYPMQEGAVATHASATG